MPDPEKTNDSRSWHFHWRLLDRFHVTDAAILITGNDPSENVEIPGEWNEDRKFEQKRDHEGYDAAFKALRFAIMSNELKADVKYPMRGMQIGFGQYFGSEPYEIHCLPHEEQVSYDFLVGRSEPADAKGQTIQNFSAERIQGEEQLYIHQEPNWEHTTVMKKDLISWLESRDHFPDFFFPKGKIEGFRDERHERYSPKLATAVAAWEAVTAAKPPGSVKQTLIEWIQDNGGNFGLGNDMGVVAQTAAKEVAKIANWDTKGGANRTPTGSHDLSED